MIRTRHTKCDCIIHVVTYPQSCKTCTSEILNIILFLFLSTGVLFGIYYALSVDLTVNRTVIYTVFQKVVH